MEESVKKSKKQIKINLNIREPNVLHETLMPLYIVTKFLGLSSYSLVKKNGKLKYKHSSIGICYSILFIFSFVTYYIFAAAERNRVSYEETHEITNAIDTFQLYSGIIVMTISVLTNTYYESAYLLAIKRIVAIDEMLEQYGLKIDHKKTRRIIMVYAFILIFVYALMENYNCSMFLREITTFSKFCSVMCYLPLLVNNFVQCQFTIYVVILRERFLLLNEKLSELTVNTSIQYVNNNKVCPEKQNVSKSSVVILSFIREVHSDLCSTGKLINKIYSLQLLLIIANTFVSFTSLAYFCFESFSIYYVSGVFNSYQTLTTLYWSASKIIQIGLLSLTCTLATNEANNTGKIIYKIDQKYDPELTKNIDFFGKQILHWNFKFTAYDFFDLNMTLLYAMICGATTYLIILVQLDDSSTKTIPTKATPH